MSGRCLRTVTLAAPSTWYFQSDTSPGWFPVLRKSHVWPLSAVMCGGERPGAFEVRPDSAADAAQLGRASRSHPKRHRGEAVPKHATVAASAIAGHPQQRDPLRFRHSREKGVCVCVCNAYVAFDHQHITSSSLSLQLNTDIETHVRSMSTRRRLPSKSTEDVSNHQWPL